jgi:hypothetical protein
MLFDIGKLTGKAVSGTIIFTVVEVVTLVAWLELAPKSNVLSIAVLAVGLLLEHLIATAVGQQDK